MKKIITILNIFFAINAFSYTSTLEVKTWKKDICNSSYNNKSINKINEGLEEQGLPVIEITGCKFVKKSKILKKNIYELELTFLDGVNEFCINSKYEKNIHVKIEGTFLPNLDSTQLQKVLSDFNINLNSVYFRATGIGYGEYHFNVPACSLKRYENL